MSRVPGTCKLRDGTGRERDRALAGRDMNIRDGTSGRDGTEAGQNREICPGSYPYLYMVA